MFSKPWQKSDAVLIVENKELYVHSQTLSLASPVFEKMFNGDLIEAQTRIVYLEGASYDLVKHLLKLIYPDDLVTLGKKCLRTLLICLYSPSPAPYGISETFAVRGPITFLRILC